MRQEIAVAEQNVEGKHINNDNKDVCKVMDSN